MTASFPDQQRLLVWNPNPTLDVVNTVANLSPGAVHQADRQLLSAGGKGTLVVRALKRLGADCLGAAPLAGHSGDIVRELLEQESLPFRLSSVSGRTRLAITITDRRTGSDTVVNGPGPETNDTRWDDHLALVDDLIRTGGFSHFVIAGRPPLSAPIAKVLGVARGASANGLRLTFDMASPTLQGCLPSNPWLVKVNIQEAQMALDQDASGPELVRLLIERGVQNVVLTDGPDTIYGSLMGIAFAARPPAVDVLSAVGCGDVFLAGLLFELSTGQVRVDEIVRTATAVASASAERSQPGFFDLARALALRDFVAVD